MIVLGRWIAHSFILIFALFCLLAISACKNPLGGDDFRDSSFAPGGGGSGGGGGGSDDQPPGIPTSLSLSTLWVTGANPVNSPIFTWTNPNDDDFEKTQVALGISIGGEEFTPFVDSSGTSSHTFNSLTLTECSQTYYPSARSVDSSGNESATVSFTGGFNYDNTNPISTGAVSIPSNDGTPSQTVTVDWSATPGTDNCGVSHYQIAIGYDDDANGFDAGDLENLIGWSDVPGGNSTTSYQIQDGVDGFSFSSTFDVQYFTSIRVVDAAGLVSSPVSSSGWYTFHPSQFTNLEIWLDGSDSSTHFQDVGCSTTPAINPGDTVRCWSDKSDQLNHAIQAGGNPPRVGITGIDFDGVDDLLSVATKTYTFTDNLTVFAFYEADTQSNDGSSCCRPIFSLASNSGALYPWVGLTRGTYTPANTLFHGWSGGPIAPIATAPGDQIINSTTHDGTAGLWNSFSFGAAQAVNIPLVNYTSTTFNVGGDSSNAARRVHGEIYEIIVIENVVTPSERQDMEGYLACKYDARDTLDPGHPYYDLVGANKSGCP